jgi:LysM repeat protein
MIAWMIYCIGADETNGNNVNFITHWYGEDYQPWCNMTITYAAWHSGNSQNVCGGTKRDYTVNHAQWFQSRGQWHTDTAGIQRGDIVFFDWDGSNSISAIDHVGIVESVSGSDVHTIEGNIDNVCKRMVRHSNYIVGYGRPKYSTASAPPPPDTTPTPPPAAGTDTYTVKAGDTLSAIARSLGVSLDALLAVNPQIANPDEIDVGQVINVPAATDQTPAPAPEPAPAPAPTPTPVPPPPYCSLFNLQYAKAHPGAHKPDVLAFQKALARTVGLDYSSGPGIYGPATTSACAKFQRLQGWAGTGAPNFDVLNQLARKTGLLIPAP